VRRFYELTYFATIVSYDLKTIRNIGPSRVTRSVSYQGAAALRITILKNVALSVVMPLVVLLSAVMISVVFGESCYG